MVALVALGLALRGIRHLVGSAASGRAGPAAYSLLPDDDCRGVIRIRPILGWLELNPKIWQKPSAGAEHHGVGGSAEAPRACARGVFGTGAPRPTSRKHMKKIVIFIFCVYRRKLLKQGRHVLASVIGESHYLSLLILPFNGVAHTGGRVFGYFCDFSKPAGLASDGLISWN